MQSFTEDASEAASVSSINVSIYERVKAPVSAEANGEPGIDQRRSIKISLCWRDVV